MAVLQNFCGAEAPGSLQKGVQFLQGLLGGGFFLGKAIRVQAHENCPFLNRFLKI